jgi:hypothetical protein
MKKSVVKKPRVKKSAAKKSPVKKVEKKEKKSLGCTRQTSKKYSDRSSPPFPANECCDQEMVGNDGSMYVSRADKNGRCAWKKVN